jgi:hypothetical protein
MTPGGQRRFQLAGQSVVCVRSMVITQVVNLVEHLRAARVHRSVTHPESGASEARSTLLAALFKVGDADLESVPQLENLTDQ